MQRSYSDANGDMQVSFELVRSFGQPFEKDIYKSRVNVWKPAGRNVRRGEADGFIGPACFAYRICYVVTVVCIVVTDPCLCVCVCVCV